MCFRIKSTVSVLQRFSVETVLVNILKYSNRTRIFPDGEYFLRYFRSYFKQLLPLLNPNDPFIPSWITIYIVSELLF